MLNTEKSGVDKILVQLEDKVFMESRYRFVRENNEFKLLGVGGFSYVYEMYDSLAPEKHYAAKIIGFGTKTVAEQIVLETTRIQRLLSEQSENVMSVIELWIMKLHLDEDGNVLDVTSIDSDGYDNAEGVVVEIIIMEKLDSILSKDKYGSIELLRDELKTEEGIIRFAQNIGRAIFIAHVNGYLHRDIKLENIFWDPENEQYKLGDFGIARYVGEENAETIVYTDGYGAPEIERKSTEGYNLTADIYSFGITLYLLLNELKFPASDGYYVNAVQYSKDFIIPAAVNASDKMARIIRKMCSYQIKDRYQSVEEVLMEIGKIDGSYTEKGFVEHNNIETETYREIDKTEEEEKLQWYDKEYSELTREEIKKINKIENEIFTSSSIHRMIITALLTVLLLKAFSPNAEYVSRWEIFVLPLIVFFEAVLQRNKEFYISFGVVTIGIAVFLMYHLKIDVPQIIVIIAVIMGMSEITAGISIGIGLWIAQMLTGKIAWLDIFSRWDLGWIVLILFLAVIESNLLLRAKYNKASKYETFIISWLIDKLWICMIIAGIILSLLEHFNVIIVPEIVKHIHLVRTGIGFLCIEIFYIWYYGLLYDEENDIDEFMDE